VRVVGNSDHRREFAPGQGTGRAQSRDASGSPREEIATVEDRGREANAFLERTYLPEHNYSDAAGTGLTASLNGAIAAPAAAFGAVVADLFTAFRIVASKPIFTGRTCNAGLLNASPQNQFLCDVHPSQSGHRLIAQAIARAPGRSDLVADGFGARLGGLPPDR
jgi:hypothetical protein